MAVSIKQLLGGPLDKTKVLADLYDVLGAIFGQPLALQPGSPIPDVLDGVVEWFVDELWNPLALPALQAQVGDFATGFWLSLLAQTLWRRPRIEAQAGTLTVVLENRGSFTGSLPVIRAKHATTGKTYSAAAGAGTITAYGGSGPYPTVSVTLTADEAGTKSNAQPNTLAMYPTALVAGPVNIFVQSNTLCFGSDEEMDGPLLARGRAAVGELSAAGPSKAYLSVALDPTGAFTRRQLTPPWPLTYVPAVTRIRVVDQAPGVAVYLASNSGPAAGNTGTPDTDVFNVAMALLLFVIPPGIPKSIQAATAHTIVLGTITLTVDAAANVTATEAEDAAKAAIDSFFAKLPIGGARKTTGGTGYVFYEKVLGVFDAPSYVVEADMPSFIADAALAAGDVAVPTYTIHANVVDQT